jgi:hypothetical protein
MILTIKNQVAGTRNYLPYGGGNYLVSVADGGQTTVPRDVNVVLVGDANFLNDLGASATGTISIVLNNGVKDLNPGEALELCKVLANFSTDPLATMILYQSLEVIVNHTGAASAGAVVWAMRNSALTPFQFVLEKILLSMAYDSATPALTKQTLGYELKRFSGADPSGGTAVTPVKASTSGFPSMVTARTLETGLTTSGITFEPGFAAIQVPAVIGATNKYERARVPVKLAPGEGLAIVLSDDAINGQSLYGEITGSMR